MGYLERGRSVVGLQGTYTIVEALPKTGFATVFRGEVDGRAVVLKEVHLAELDAWSRIDALDREAVALAGLEHPRIPRLVELFVLRGEKAEPRSSLTDLAESDARAASLVLVRSFVEGASLAEASKAGRLFVASELERIFVRLLELRGHLDSLLPPVVHGDVAPSNIVLDPNGDPWLIDFGAGAGSGASRSGATVGSDGFMPDEQIEGTPAPASDLYAMAMSILVTASRKGPSELPRDPETNRIRVSEAAPLLSTKLVRALSTCLEPELAKRPARAADVLRLLRPAGNERARAALRWGRRRALVLAGGATFAVVIAIAAHRPKPVTPLAPMPIIRTKVVVSPPRTVTVKVPADCPAPPRPPPSEPFLDALQWVGQVTQSTEIARGQMCVVEVRAKRVEDSSSAAACALTVKCGDQILLDPTEADQCVISWTHLPGEVAAFRVALARPHEEGRLDTAFYVDPKKDQLRLESVDDKGRTTRSTVVSMGKRSFPVRSWDRGNGAATELFESERTIEGTLVEVSDPDTGKLGDRCSLSMRPNAAAEVGSEGANCRAVVRCRGKTLYDGSGTCKVDPESKPFAFSDNALSSIDGDGTLLIEERFVTVGDASTSGRFGARIFLDSDPGPAPGPHDSP